MRSDRSTDVTRRPRGVLGGAVLVAVGAAFFLPALGVPDASSYLFLALGIAFAAAYATSASPSVYLIPAATLLGLGVGLLLPGWIGLRADIAQVVFLACLAIALAAAYLVRPQRRWPLVPAAVLAVVALVELFGAGTIVPGVLQPFFVPTVLVLIGAYLIAGPREG